MNSALPETMRAAVIDATGGPEVFRIAEVPRAFPISAELLVEVHAAGVNPIDAKTRGGKGVSAAIPAFPAILGSDFAGVVAASPYDAYPLQPGDRVYGMIPVPRTSGSLAEYAPISALGVARAPQNLELVDAAAVPLAALTAWGALHDGAGVQAGQRVLVHAGAGGVGHFAVQLAKIAGAEVIATASAANADFVRSLGADRVIDYRSERFEEVVGDIDAVIDLIGNVADDTGSRSLKVLAADGIIVNVPTGSWPTFHEEAAAAGLRGTTYKVSPDGRRLAQITDLIEQGRLRVHVDEVFPLERVADAHRRAETGHVRGKLVVRIRS
ncbi:NADP-dependent oxidoreductase [Microbacterium sp. Marseille-Q6965]|uniref:NADP-dependent oxidoreductase n=1 Tax=Microbacterium sp. Marseille-Q6965 TaxID=2965072 RepID=UPI0021B76D2B|nr:NADP-dependent oxidoreductase [Microbacterium sp. Marseille-Q6965]